VGTSYEDLCTFMLCCWILLIIRTVFDKVVEKIKTYFLCSIVYFFEKKSRVRDNVEKCSRTGQITDGSIVWRMRFACWIIKAAVAHSNCEIITALPREQRLH
jgi:hypothetical protein